MKYTVKGSSDNHKLEIARGVDFSDNVPVEVGKKTFAVRVHEKSSTGELRAVAVNNKIYSVQVRRRPDGFPYKVILNGTAYPVEIARVESTRYKPPVAERKVEGTIRAMLPGQVRLLVSEGDKVKKGQIVAVLEAMKMENEIPAPIDGVVKKVSVQAKQLVMKRDLLLELEPG